MQTTEHHWEVERAAAWLRRHGWSEVGEERAPPLPGQEDGGAGHRAAAGPGAGLPFWPPLVAPLYGAMLRAN